jgi:hypothetical protein
MREQRALLWLSRSARIAGTVLVLALLALLSAPWGKPASSAPPAETVLYQEDFEDGQAQDWDLERGWTVTRDADGQGTLGRATAEMPGATTPSHSASSSCEAGSRSTSASVTAPATSSLSTRGGST